MPPGLWALDTASRRSSRKTINHPHVGPLTLDCDTLEVRDSDLRLIYTAPASSPAARALELIGMLGLEEMSAGVGV
jgi:hypothetical protein